MSLLFDTLSIYFARFLYTVIMAGTTHDTSPEVLGTTPETTHTTESHGGHEAGPHILAVTGEPIHDWQIAGYPITTTVFSTWIVMAVIFVFVALFQIALRTELMPRIRSLGIDVIKRFDSFLMSIIDDKKAVRVFLPLVAGFFVFIFVGNVMGLIFDYMNMSAPALHAYLRPVNAEISTTLVMALATIIIAQGTAIIVKGPVHHFVHYLFNFSGHGIVEKIINVPVGWIHFLGEFTRVISLSVRLFANIFAGVALIGVIAYLGTLLPLHGLYGLGGFLVLPFWFFELLVAFLQAFIFMTLASVYLKESITKEAH